MGSRYGLLVLFALLSASLIGQSSIARQPHSQKSILISSRTLTLGPTAGKVQINSRTRRRGATIYEGNRIRTSGFVRGRQSKATIKLDFSQGIVLIGPRSSIRISKLRRNNGGAVTEIEVDSGSAWAVIRKLNNPYSKFVIQYKGGPRQIIRGTEFGIAYNGVTGAIITKSGQVAILNGSTSAVIGPGEGVIIRSDGLLSVPLPVTQTLRHDALKVERLGAFWQVSGQVVIEHCLLNNCISEPVNKPEVAIFGQMVKTDQFGHFQYRTKPPILGNSIDLRISYRGRTSIIKLNTRGLLPRNR